MMPACVQLSFCITWNIARRQVNTIQIQRSNSKTVKKYGKNLMFKIVMPSFSSMAAFLRGL